MITTPEVKLAFLKKCINQMKETSNDMNIDTKLSDLELDSLDIVELQMLYEDEFSVETITTDDNCPLITIGDIIKIL